MKRPLVLLWENPGESHFTQARLTHSCSFLFLPPESQIKVSRMAMSLPAGKTEGEGGETETHRMFVTQRNELHEDFMRNF